MPQGGSRPGAGRKKKTLAENLLDGNPGKRPIKVLGFGDANNTADLPHPPEFLKEAARGNAGFPSATEIFEVVTKWLEQTGCLHLISPEHISEYALLKARWLECEAKNAQHGLLAKHPTSGQPIASPFVRIGIDYLKAADAAWNKIWVVVAQNSERDYTPSSPNGDVMENLLMRKKSKHA